MTKKKSVAPERLAIANTVLASFANGTTMEYREKQGIVILWTNSQGQAVSRKWQCRRGSDFYSVWSDRWPHGGTACMALSQLVRWVKDQPVFPIGVWRRWAGEGYKLVGEDAIAQLLEGGYPDRATCIFCEKKITRQYDWYNVGKKSGPGCWQSSACGQKRLMANGNILEKKNASTNSG